MSRNVFTFLASLVLAAILASHHLVQVQAVPMMGAGGMGHVIEEISSSSSSSVTEGARTLQQATSHAGAGPSHRIQQFPTLSSARPGLTPDHWQTAAQLNHAHSQLNPGRIAGNPGVLNRIASMPSHSGPQILRPGVGHPAFVLPGVPSPGALHPGTPQPVIARPGQPPIYRFEHLPGVRPGTVRPGSTLITMGTAGVHGPGSQGDLQRLMEAQRYIINQRSANSMMARAQAQALARGPTVPPHAVGARLPPREEPSTMLTLASDARGKRPMHSTPEEQEAKRLRASTSGLSLGIGRAHSPPPPPQQGQQAVNLDLSVGHAAQRGHAQPYAATPPRQLRDGVSGQNDPNLNLSLGQGK